MLVCKGNTPLTAAPAAATLQLGSPHMAVFCAITVGLLFPHKLCAPPRAVGDVTDAAGLLVLHKLWLLYGSQV